MKLWLFLLSHFSISVALQHVLHLISHLKSWDEAREFCRNHYTDLATVNDVTDQQKLKQVANGADAWIGLRNRTGDQEWGWSQPAVKFDKIELEWGVGEPNNHDGQENCAIINNYKKWDDRSCAEKHCFICYNDTTPDPIFIPGRKKWLDAQRYCRKHHSDLISGLDQLNQLDLPDTGSRCDHLYWIGLFRDTWGWSDGSNSSFRNWEEWDEHMNKHYQHDQKNCVRLGAQGQWIRDFCKQARPFICYEKYFILVKENKTWEEAMDYCRHHYRDLAWFDTPHLQTMVQERAKMADSEVVWVGLHYTCFLEEWIWVTGHYVDRHDANWKKPDNNDCGVNGAMEREGDNKWVKRHSQERHNFICARYC